MQPQPKSRPTAPFFTAPGIVVWVCAALVLAHGLRLVVPYEWQNAAFYWLALIPARLDIMLEGGGRDSYGLLSLPVAVFGHVLLHGDWMHVLLNAGMLLALGAPVVRRQSGPRFIMIFLVAAGAGAVAFFLLRPPDGAPAIGASGGVSGILAAAFLIMAGPRAGWPELVSRSFLQTSAAFALLNLLIALFGPQMFGAAVAWDAHMGGYIAGALAMAALSRR